MRQTAIVFGWGEVSIVKTKSSFGIQKVDTSVKRESVRRDQTTSLISHPVSRPKPHEIPKNQTKHRTLLLVVCFFMFVDLILFPSMKAVKVGGSVGALRVAGVSISFAEVANALFISFLIMIWRRSSAFRGLPKWYIVVFNAFIVLAGIASIRGINFYGIAFVFREARTYIYLVYAVAMAGALPLDTMLSPFVKDAPFWLKAGVVVFLGFKLIGILASLASVPIPALLQSSWETSLIVLLFGILAYSQSLISGLTVWRLVSMALSGAVVLLGFSKPVYLAVLIAVTMYAVLSFRLRGRSAGRFRHSIIIMVWGLCLALPMYGLGLPLPFVDNFTRFWELRVLKGASWGDQIADVDLSGGRFDIWRTGLVTTWQDNPLLGVGIGTEIEPEYTYYYRRVQGTEQAHNLFVATVFQVGYPAGVLLLVITIGFFFRSIHYIGRLFSQRDRSPEAVAAMVGCCVFFWCMMGTSLVGLVLKQPRLAFITSLCLAITICGMSEYLPGERHHAESPRSRELGGRP